MRYTTFIVKTIQDLKAIKDHKAKYADFTLDLISLTKKENEYWTYLLRKDFAPCGCKSGSYYTIIAFTFALTWALFNIEYVSHKPLKYSLIILLFILITAFVGKALGIVLSKRRFRNNIYKLEKKLNSRFSAKNTIEGKPR